MRIGTWNLDGRWSDAHRDLLIAQDADLWLLTEVDRRVSLDDYDAVRTRTAMSPSKTWSAIFARQPLAHIGSPHPATAAATTRSGDLTIWSSILPWRGCGSAPPWSGDRHADRIRAVLRVLQAGTPRGPLIWGGDWNQALVGRECVGSREGRQLLTGMLAALELQTPTDTLEHRLPDLATIDHIAVPRAWTIQARHRIRAQTSGSRLSDHDMYLIECQPARPAPPPDHSP